MMSTQQLTEEIREANLTYLLLAQQLIRQDRAEALFRLGISDTIADTIDKLSTAQLIKIASSSMLLARLRFEDSVVWTLLSNQGKPVSDTADAPSHMHAAILMASRTAERVQ